MVLIPLYLTQRKERGRKDHTYDLDQGSLVESGHQQPQNDRTRVTTPTAIGATELRFLTMLSLNKISSSLRVVRAGFTTSYRLYLKNRFVLIATKRSSSKTINTPK